MPPWAWALLDCCSAVLGDHQDRELRVDGQGRPQPGQAAADDQHVGEEMRDVLGMERDEVAGNVKRH